jgi:hypothetical protein
MSVPIYGANKPRRKANMELHPSTFDHVKPTDEQAETMRQASALSKGYADDIAGILPDGADKAYVLRRIRETAMWINTAIMREDDGSPRMEI